MESSKVTEEIMTFYGRCRCCLDYGYMKSMWKEHMWDDEREIYGEMIMETFEIAWNSNSTDDHICESCVTRLRDAYHFKKEVLSSEILLQENDEDDSNGVNFKEEMDSDGEFIVTEQILEDGADEDSHGMEIKTENEYGEIEFLEEDAEIVEQSVSTIDKETDSDSVPKRGRGKRDRTGYRKYTQADLRKCIQLLQQSDGMSQSQAAKMFNIPTKTVNAKIRSLMQRNDDTQDQPKEITKHRNNIHTILKYTNATPIKGHRGIGYTCFFCPKQYAKATDLKTHTYTHNNMWKRVKVPLVFAYTMKLDITGLECKICRSNIDDLSLEGSMQHLKNHGKIIHTDIKNHIMPFKFDTDVLQCIECSETFSYFKLLSAHMSEHYPNHKCKECGKGFVTKHALRTHSYRHDLGVFPCGICDKTFSTQSRMRNHERVVHILQNKTQKCSYCTEKFVDVVQKSNHEVSIHGAEPKKFLCGYCDKVYDSQRALTSHVKRCHLMLRPHVCDYCQKSFFKKSSLQKHLVTHTGVRNYACEICTKTFGTRTTLVKHMRVHSKVHENNVIHTCFHCERSFPLLSQFQSHYCHAAGDSGNEEI